jgi:hypothetical protein
MTMRDQIASIIADAAEDGLDAADVAGIILAALPGMVPDLVWKDESRGILSSSAATINGKYHVAFDDGVGAWYASLEIGDHENPILIEPLDVDTFSAAKAAAKAHNRAAVCKAMGLHMIEAHP